MIHTWSDYKIKERGDMRIKLAERGGHYVADEREAEAMRTVLALFDLRPEDVDQFTVMFSTTGPAKLQAHFPRPVDGE